MVIGNAIYESESEPEMVDEIEKAIQLEETIVKIIL